MQAAGLARAAHERQGMLQSLSQHCSKSGRSRGPNQSHPAESTPRATPCAGPRGRHLRKERPPVAAPAVHHHVPDLGVGAGPPSRSVVHHTILRLMDFTLSSQHKMILQVTSSSIMDPLGVSRDRGEGRFADARAGLREEPGPGVHFNGSPKQIESGWADRTRASPARIRAPKLPRGFCALLRAPPPPSRFPPPFLPPSRWLPSPSLRSRLLQPLSHNSLLYRNAGCALR